MLRWGIAVCVLLLCASTVWAQNKDAAKAAYRRGTQHYNLNEIPQALDAFKEAYRAFEEPSFLFNIGQCQRRLGQNEEAIQSFRSYLRNVSNPPNRDEVERLLEKLNEQVKLEKAEREQKAQAALEAARAVERQKQAEAAERAAATQNAVVAAAPTPQKTPVYKKWWLWTIVGGVVVVGVGVGLGLAFGLPPTDKFGKSSNATDGTVRF